MITPLMGISTTPVRLLWLANLDKTGTKLASLQSFWGKGAGHRRRDWWNWALRSLGRRPRSPNTSRANHSCVPNGDRSFIGDMMIIRATREIKAGEEIRLSYA